MTESQVPAGLREWIGLDFCGEECLGSCCGTEGLGCWDEMMKWNEGFSALNGLTMPHSRHLLRHSGPTKFQSLRRWVQFHGTLSGAVRHFNSRDFATALRGLGELLAETARSTQVLKRHLSGTLRDTKKHRGHRGHLSIFRIFFFCLHIRVARSCTSRLPLAAPPQSCQPWH